MNLDYIGKGLEVFKIWIVNLFLQIITFGIYRPWAKTKMRKYLYGSISVFGEELEYSGTGKELFYGSAKAIGWLVLFILIASLVLAAVFFASGLESSIQGFLEDLTGNLVGCFGVFLLVAYAQFSSLRYRLNRSRWRSIKAQLSGKAKDYVILKLKRMILNIVSFGSLIGRSDILARQFLIERIAIGSTKFSFKGDYTGLDRVNFIALIPAYLALPSIFIFKPLFFLMIFVAIFARIWYGNKRRNYFWNSIRIGEDIKFSSNFGFRRLLWLWISNSLMIVFSLGLAIPFCIHRSVRFVVENIQISGSPENVEFLQSQQNSTATGDGLDGLLGDASDDMDVDFGIW